MSQAGKETRERDSRTSQVVRGFGMALNQVAVYGPLHRVAVEASDNAYATLAEHLENIPEIVIARLDDELLVNGQAVDLGGPVERALLPAMTNLTINSFTLEQGLSRESFIRLIQILAKGSQYQPGEVSEATFKRALEVAGIKHVGIHHIRYERVRDDEAVVAKERILFDGERPRTGFDLVTGISTYDTKATGEAIARMLDSPESLSRAILQVAEKPQNQEEMNGLLTQLAKALESTFEQIPSTPTAFRNASRQIEKLRRELAAQAENHPGVDSGKLSSLDQMLAAASNALKVEVFAEEYRKRKAALARSERQIASFVRTLGNETLDEFDFRSRLAESGMTFAEWSDVLSDAARRHRSKTKGGAIDRIQEIAGELRETTGEIPREEIEKALEAAHQAALELDAVSDDLGAKISALVAAAHEDQKPRKPGEEGPPRLSRKELFARLAEIGQELCQPLSVISAAVDMIASNHLGEVNESQLSMLKLAGEGTERMRKLIYALMEIADVPQSLTPDQSIIAGLY